MTLKELLLEACKKMDDNPVTLGDKMRLAGTLGDIHTLASNDALEITDEDMTCLPQSARQIALLGFASMTMMALQQEG